MHINSTSSVLIIILSVSLFYFPPAFNNKKPSEPDSTDAVRMENFATAMVSGSTKDNSEINIDMVKPIPANNATPTI